MALDVINIPIVDNVDELRKQLQNILQRLAIRISAPAIDNDMDLTNHRIKNVARPVDNNDVVTLGYLREQTPPQFKLSRMQKQLLNINPTSTMTVTNFDGFQLEVLAP